MNFMRLDEERLEALRSWGARLGEASGEEHAAIGRAILMLVDEIDRLHIELWHARMRPSEPQPVPTSEPTEEEQPVLSSLRARMRQALNRDEAGEHARRSKSDSDADTEADATSSAQDWITALRRQQ